MWEGDGEVKQRLDRCLGSVGWVQLFDISTCTHIEKEASDHCILVLDTYPTNRKYNRRFFFYQRWTRNPKSKEVIQMAWDKEQRGSRMFKVARKIKECIFGLLERNKKIRGNSRVRINEIKNQLENAKARKDPNKKSLMTNLKMQLSKAYKEEELYWSQKSRNRWLKEGDKNTAFFHLSVMAKRKRNRISLLQKSNGEWCMNV